ncbi:hypothetical protein EV421DRAFT_1734703 [Armillaria borealis]|uniref:Uncharacterized protein n=1 Tax=Armillaria borealis TaxID=47425 RepID=A0AA39JPA0_9AGAR|nr:hypothetical protein EV421DRAFT_1734703 [Armillaria borealis]
MEYKAVSHLEVKALGSPLESPVCSLQRNHPESAANTRGRDREAHLLDHVPDFVHAAGRGQSYAVLREAVHARNHEVDVEESRRAVFVGKERLQEQVMDGEAEGSLDVAQETLAEVQVTVCTEKVKVRVVKAPTGDAKAKVNAVEVKLGDVEVMQRDVEVKDRAVEGKDRGVEVKNRGVGVKSRDVEVNDHVVAERDHVEEKGDHVVEKGANAGVNSGAEAKGASVEENDEAAAATSDLESEASMRAKVGAQVTLDDVEVEVT